MLFPFARGRQIAAAAVTPTEAAALGYGLAVLHGPINDFQYPRLAPRSRGLDTATTLAMIQRYRALIRALPEPQPSDHAVLHRLDVQERWIVANAGLNADALGSLRSQPIHGDINAANLFFDDGQISAIIDWDQTYLAPLAWELARTIDLVLRWHPPLIQALLRSYRAVLPLRFSELDIAVRSYATLRGYDLWMFQAVYDEANDRIRQFIERPFHDLLARWINLRPLLES